MLWGAGAGALVGAGVWYVAQRRLDQRLSAGEGELAAMLGTGREQLVAELEAGRQDMRAAVQAQVQALVPSAIDAQLAMYGVTPQLIERVDRVLRYGESAGVL